MCVSFRFGNEKKRLEISSKECSNSLQVSDSSMFVTSALGRLRQEGCFKFKASLGYISTRLVRVTQ